MSLETPREVGAAPGGNLIISSSNHSNSHSIVLDHVNEAALAAALQGEITSTLGPQKNETQRLGTESPAVEESAEARLERLGRQRPKVFDSAWAEIGFVFSISMSQVLSVS